MIRLHFRLRQAAFFSAALLLCHNPLFAISGGKPRVTTETPHFEITVVHSKSEVLPEAAAWLENAYEKESQFFDFETTKKIQVVLLDEEDYSNGFAYAPNQWIAIYLPPTRFYMRGTTQWFPNVSAHELAHILTLRKMGLDSKFSGVDVFGSWDRQNGHLDGDAAWIPKSVPAWLAEGLAQYGSMHSGFDTLDSHREMLLREAWNSGNLLPLKMIETFSADSRSSEMTYNEGFHLVDYLYRTYGGRAMNAMMSSWNSKGYTGSFRSAFGASPDEVYRQWKTDLDVRFTNSDARPEALSLSEPVFTVDDAPVYDPATHTLYYLSSAANDFGITRLYAQTGNMSPVMIQSDVNPPLHLTPDHTLIYPAVRINPGTDARISDLYTYRPKTREAVRVTFGQRAIAGVATSGKELYAIVRRAGKTSIVQMRRSGGEIKAPPGTEFMDLAFGDDTTLYVSAARGNNSDIFRLNTRTQSLTPLLASRHNERDPFVLNGRLYFSSDQDGSYAIYSLQGDTLFRHTAPGPSAFAPSTDGKTLRYSAYTPHGFLLRSQPLDSGAIVAMLGNPSNEPFTPPAEIQTTPGPDRTHLELVAYQATLGYAHTRHHDIGEVLRFNPCVNQGFMGGGFSFSDPQTRNSLDGEVDLGNCLDASHSVYLPLALLQYQNSDFAHDFFLQAYYQNLQVELSTSPTSTSRGLLDAFGVQTGMVLNLSNYFYDIPKVSFGVSRLNIEPNDYYNYSETETRISNVLGFRFLDPGADFINRGILGSVSFQRIFIGGDNSGDGSVLETNLELHGNILHTLFLTARGDWAVSGGVTDAAATLAADMRIPQGFTVGGVGYRGLYLESIFLHGAYSVADYYSSFSLTQPAAFTPPIPRMTSLPRSFGASPSYIYNPGLPVQTMVELALRLKIITPSSRVTMWNIGWQAHPEDLAGGYYTVSISL